MENYASSEKDPEIPFSDDEVVRDEDLIIDEDKPGATPEEKKARQEKRRERAATRERERKEQAEELKALKEREAQTQRELAELRGAVSRGPAAPPAPREDPFKKRLDSLEARRKSENAAYQAEVKAGLTPERAQHWDSVGRELEEAKIEILTERAIAIRDAREVPARRQEQAQQIWVQKYPEVYQNANAFEYAKATFQQRLALGEKPTNELNDEIFSETMARFKLGKKPAPSATERSRLSGVSANGGGGAGNTSGGIQMTREFKKMAEAMYSDLPADKAHQKWVNEVGKPLRQRKVI